MNSELAYQFKQRIADGVYHFDFMIINQGTLKSNKVGYIIVNTRSGNISYHLSSLVTQIAPKEDVNNTIKTVMEAAIALNTTIGPVLTEALL